MHILVVVENLGLENRKFKISIEKFLNTVVLFSTKAYDTI
jgi:hypothetical protein